MKLYYKAGACSLASHITLREAGAQFTLEAVDLAQKRTASGEDFLTISPRGAVPTLEIEPGTILTEGVAIMQYVMDQFSPGALPTYGSLARARLQEALNFIATEVHTAFGQFFRGPMTDEARQGAEANLRGKLKLVEEKLADGREWMCGEVYSPADAYIFTTTNWTHHLGLSLDAYPRLIALRAKIAARPSVQAAMQAEGLI